MNKKRHGGKRHTQTATPSFEPVGAEARACDAIPRKETIDAILSEGDPNVSAGVYEDLLTSSFYRKGSEF